MADLIDRQAALDILKFKPIDDGGAVDDCIMQVLALAKSKINKLPSVDAVEVVRCKDCKYGENIDTKNAPYKYYKPDCVVCKCEDVVGDEPMIYLPSHFCGYGERREENA